MKPSASENNEKSDVKSADTKTEEKEQKTEQNESHTNETKEEPVYFKFGLIFLNQIDRKMSQNLMKRVNKMLFQKSRESFHFLG
jgi:hypothetical protein